jgi:hypothetical protein
MHINGNGSNGRSIRERRISYSALTMDDFNRGFQSERIWWDSDGSNV